jgi:hypothetical protein
VNKGQEEGDVILREAIDTGLVHKRVTLYVDGISVEASPPLCVKGERSDQYLATRVTIYVI